MATSLTANKTTAISLAKGDRLSIAGEGAWSYYAFDSSGLQLDSGSYSDPDVIGPFSEVGTVNLTASAGSSLSYDTLPASVGNAAFDAQGRLLDETGAVVLDVGAAQDSGLRIGAYNLRPDNMRKWRRAAAGGVDAILLNVGDSTTRGQSGGTNPGPSGTTPNGEHAGSYPVQLHNKLKAMSYPVSQANFSGGTSYTVANQNLADPRLVIPSDWSMLAPTLGGLSISCASGVSTILQFTPVEQFNAVDIYYIGRSTSGTMSVSVDAGAALDTWSTTNATAGVYKRTITGITLGTHTLKISRSIGGTIYLSAVVCRNTTAPAINVINAGAAGSTSSEWSLKSDPWRAIFAIGAVAPNLTIINLGINDANASVNVATYKTNMRAIANAAKVSGDIAFVKFVQPNPAGIPTASTESYWSAVKELADELDCPIFLCADRLGSYDTATADGYMYDWLHPRAAGYSEMATLIARALASV